MAGGGGQVGVAGEDARRADHEIEAAAQPQRLDQRLVHLDPWHPAPEMREHPGVRVDADDLDAGPVQRRGEPAHTNAQVQHRPLRLPAPVEPRPQVLGFPKRGVEVGEARIGVVRVVPDSD